MVLPRQPRNGFSKYLRVWVHAFIRLLLKMTLADIACSIVIEWMVYFIVARKDVSKPEQGGGGGVRVIICGISRSGSNTLQCALDILGLPCFHGCNTLNPTKRTLLMKAYKSGKKEDWDHLLKGYTAISDYPAAACYKQLVRLYPDAKVVLNIRDPELWYKSFSQTLLKSTPMVQMLRPFKGASCIKELLFNGLLKGKAQDKELAIQMYKQHTEEVKAHVQPPNKLLVYEFGEATRGWAPLCEFLGKDVPQVPFPSTNDTQSFQNRLFRIETIENLVVASYFAFLCLTISFLLKHIV